MHGGLDPSNRDVLSIAGMRELLDMWRNTRMVVLTATCASFYAAVLIPFMVIPLVPGLTHFRPANALPVVCSFLFGPAAAWGAAFGNLIGDFFGGLGPGDAFGFVGNFLYALAPYRLWRACAAGEPLPATPSGWALLFVIIGTASMLCAATVGFGLQVLGFVPFAVLANIVLVNNFVTSAVLVPLLLAVLYPRVQKARLLYIDVLTPSPRAPLPRRVVGVGLAIAGTVAAFTLGNLVSSGWMAPLGGALSPRLGFVLTVLPALAVGTLGLALL
jgi:energy-coupling factor transport system substrate-specific component